MSAEEDEALLLRDPRACEFRRDLRPSDGGETARCQLLGKISGVRDRAVLDTARIGFGVCQLCCLEAKPLISAPNPTVASQLLRLLDEIERRGGVSGCDINKVLALRSWAAAYLMRLGDPRQRPRVPGYRGRCLHLRDRLPASGSPARYKCAHELHEETTIARCKRCFDYDPPLRSKPVEAWAVGVITAPRQQPTLQRTLASLRQAGWEDPFVFADAGTRIERGLVSKQRLVRRAVRYYSWANYISALNELMLIHPHADAYLLIEDDVVFCKGLRAYLEAELWPGERTGFVSLYAASHQDRGDGSGFFPHPVGAGLWGALALVFPNASARRFVRHPWVVNHRSRGPREGTTDQDLVAGIWSSNAGLTAYLHTPSLSQHIGETSAVWGDSAKVEGYRAASSFPGEAKDIRRVMAGIRGAKKRHR